MVLLLKSNVLNSLQRAGRTVKATVEATEQVPSNSLGAAQLSAYVTCEVPTCPHRTQPCIRNGQYINLLLLSRIGRPGEPIGQPPC